jgi:hypothetical protein
MSKKETLQLRWPCGCAPRITQRSPLRSQELLKLLPRLVALGGARRARVGAELLGPRLQQVEELVHLALERRVGGVGLEDGVRHHLHTVGGWAGRWAGGQVGWVGGGGDGDSVRLKALAHGASHGQCSGRAPTFLPLTLGA